MEILLENRLSVLVIALVLVVGTVVPGMMVLGSGERGEGLPFETANDGDKLVLVYAWNEEDIEEIGQHGEIIDHYGRNVLIETNPRGVRELDSAYQIDRLKHRNEVSVKGHRIDTTRGLSKLDSELKIEDYESGTEGLYVVDMIGPINPEWREQLVEEGVDIVNYQPNYAYEVVMTPEQAEDVRDLFFVDWVGIYQPEFKLHSRLDEALDKDMPVNVRLRPGFETNSLMQIESEFEVLGAEDLRENGFKLIVDVNSEKELEDLAVMNDVYYVSPYVEPELNAEMSIQLIGGGQWFMDDEYETRTDLSPEPREGDPQEPYREHGDYGAYMNQLGYTGEGLTITTADTGVGDGTVGDAGVEDFTGRVIGGHGFGDDEDEWQGGHYHGTACTGLIAGDTVDGTGETWDENEDGDMPYYMGQGLASDSEIFATKIFDDDGEFLDPPYYEIIEEPAQQSDAYIHSNSWGAGTMGEYSDTDEVYDQGVRDADRDADGNQPMVITTSAGNDGGRGDYDQEIGSPANAKNVITVGGNQPYNPGLDHENPEDMYDSSSRGWTEDNRIKPDVIAPSDNVISQNTPLDDGGYISASGTSFGNPLAAGAATIVVDWYEQNYEETPSPAMVKSILINTANELDPEVGDTDENAPDTYGHVPNRNEGWGVPDISKLEYPTDDPIGFEFSDQENLLETGDVEEYTISPDDTEEPLKVTLTWTDKNALQGDSANGTPTLKNNLDLEVETPGGEIIRGNAFDQTGDGISDDGFTYPDAEVMSDFDYNEDGWDDVNNVENVYIHPDEVESGTYTVKVMGTNIPEDANDDGTANQDFALTAYNVPEVSIPDKDGQIMFERDEYAGNEMVNITLSDVILEGEGTHDVNISSLDANGNLLENMTVTLDEMVDEEGQPLGVFKNNVTLTEDPAGDGLYVEDGGEIVGWYWDEDPGHPDEIEEEQEKLELGGSGEQLYQDTNIAVIDETDYHNGEIAANLEARLPDEYTVDTLQAGDIPAEMENYDGFVPWRFGSDSLAQDFLDELEDDQGVVYLDSDEGYSAEGYGDAVKRLYNVRDDPGTWWGASTSGPVEIEIYEDHEIFQGIGGAGDVVTLYDDTGTVYGSHYDDYTGEDLAEVRYDGGADVGEGLGINEDENEIIFPAMSIDYFAGPNDPWTEDAWDLLANSVVYTDQQVLEVESPPSVVNSVDPNPVEIMVSNLEDQNATDVPVDVTIYDENNATEYFNETTVDVEAGSETLAVFDDWTPSGEGEYLLNTTAEMHGENHSTLMDISVSNIDDAGVEEIISPVDWVNSEEAHAVETSVKNYGTMDQTDIPVNTTISHSVETKDIYENFTGGLPTDWTVTDVNGNNNTWTDTLGDYMQVNATEDDEEDYMTTGSYDFSSSESSVEMELNSDHDGYNTREVYISNDDGSTWEAVDTDVSDGVNEYDLTEWAAGEGDVRIQFRFLDSYNSPPEWWRIDDFGLTGYGLETEYTDEITISDLNATESITANFADWTPSGEGEFFINSTTELAGDEDSTNDYQTKTILVEDYHDVGVTEVLSPTGEAFIEETLNVSASVENFGSYDEDVPVNATIGHIAEVLNEDFGEEIPADWIIDNTTEEPNTWHHDGDMAYVEEQEDWQDEWLITPTLNMSGKEGTTLGFDHDFYTSSSSGDSYGRVMVTPDGGDSWEMIEEWEPEETASGVFEYDISQYADGQEEVQAAFVFNSTDAPESTYDDWEIHEVTVDYTNPVYEDNLTIDLNMQEENEVQFNDWDPDNPGEHRVTIRTDMEGDMDTTNDAEIEYITITADHDIVIDEMTHPESVVWNETQPVEASISNEGDFDEEDVPVNATAERVVGIMEDFSGEFPSSGWQTDDWTQSDSNEAGGESPEAELSYSDIEGDYAYLKTPASDTSDASELTLEFKSYISHFTDTFDARVLARSTTEEEWEDITPWSNPVDGDVGPDTYEVNITDHIGPGTQMMFEFEGDSWNINNWYLDDVMAGYTEEEYSDTSYLDINVGETKPIEFQNWTPTSAGNYIFNVTADHPEEDYPETATMEKGVYAKPMIWDLEATSIDEPTEPIFQYEEEVSGTVTNVGNQNITESTPVNMTIEPIQEEIPLHENFSDGLPDNWTVEDNNQNDNTWEIDEEEERMKIAPEDDLEHDIMWTEIINCTMGEHRVLLEFYSDLEGPNMRSLLISRDGGENYRRIDANVSEGEQLYDITQYVSEEEEVMIGWEFFSSEVEEDEFWTIDDVKITNEYTTPEYHSTAYLDELNVTEDAQLQFDSWTPAEAELPTDYLATMTTDHPEDENMENVEIYKRVFAREHVPPEKPIDPSPYDGEENVTHSPVLNVTLYGDDQLDMDATFYLYDDEGNEIGNKTASGVSSGEEAEVQFLLLETNSTFQWNVTVDDGIMTNESDTWTFHTYEPEGMWKTARADINTAPPEPVENLSVDWDAGVWDVEGTEITWDASPDDGAGVNDTDHYVIYRSNSETGPWNKTTMIDTVAADTSVNYTYFDAGRGDDGVQWYYVVRAVDRVDNMEMNNDSVGEPPIPTATDPDPAHEEVVQDLNQTLSTEVNSPTGEPLNVKIYNGTTREILAEHHNVTSGRVEADYILTEEDMGQDQYWFVVASYENYSVGTIEPTEYELTVNTAGGGTVELDPEESTYVEGTTVNLTAVPDEDWEFVNWTGDYEGTEKEITITMDEDKEITANFQYLGDLEGEWRWLYEGEHRPDTADNALAAADPQVWYGGMVLDLSDDVGGFISEVAYFDYDATANYVKAHVAEDDGGAPGDWLASSDEYDPVGGETWAELELNEDVEIEDPGEYWIVIEIDDPAEEDLFSFGTIDPDVEDGQWINFGDPQDPGDWDDLASDLGIYSAWGLEAYVEVPSDGLAENSIDEELTSQEMNVAVVDETNYQDGEIAANLEQYLPDDYVVDTLEASELIDEMENYDAFVPWRFGSDSLAQDFLNELEDHQHVVYLDSYEGATSEGYGDAMRRLHNIRGDPGTRWAESSTEPPLDIELYQDHPIFEGVGSSGDTVQLYDGSTVWGSYYDSYSGDNLAEVQYGDGTTGHGVGIDEDKGEILLPAMSIDYFATADDSGWTTESWTLLANSVEYLSGDIEYEGRGWRFQLEDTIGPEADAGEDITAYQGDTVTLNGINSTDNVGVVNWTWSIEDPMGGIDEVYGSMVNYTLDYALYYTVTLTVYDAAGNSDTDTIEIYAIDTEDPVADAGVPDQIRVGEKYTLNGSASTDNVGIVNWTWYIEGLSDEAEGYVDMVEGETVDYVFPYQGSYDVTLLVSDAENNTDMDSKWMVVDSELFELNVTVEGQGDVYPDYGWYENGTEVELTAVPEQGWKFVEWSGDYNGTEEEITIMMDEDKNLTAHFEEDMNMTELTVHMQGNGTVEVEGEPVDDGWTGEYEEGTEVTLTAMPAEGYEFAMWTGDHGSTEEEITITMDINKDITAHFEEIQEDENILTISRVGEGTTEPEPGSHTYTAGEEVTVEAMPAEGWSFVEWTGDYEGMEDVINITMDEDKEITAHFQEEPDVNMTELMVNIEGSGAVEVEGEPVDDGWTGEYEEGTEVTLTAMPAEGYEFAMWTGDHGSTEEEITITMDINKDITAHFEQVVEEMYELTVATEGEGEIEINPNQTEYEEGTEVTLTAMPAEGYGFAMWTGDHGSTEEEITITMDEDKQLTAHFEMIEETYTLDLNFDEGAGTVETDPNQTEYDAGTEVTLTASPEEGYEFAMWTGDHGSTEEEITIMMNDDMTITAHFEEIMYQLTIETEGHGDVDINPDQMEFSEGEEVTLSASSGDNWKFVEWTGDHEGEGGETTITMDDDMTITAHFEEEEEEGVIAGTGAMSYLWILVIILLILVIILAVMLMRKGKEEPEEEMEEEPEELFEEEEDTGEEDELFGEETEETGETEPSEEPFEEEEGAGEEDDLFGEETGETEESEEPFEEEDTGEEDDLFEGEDDEDLFGESDEMDEDDKLFD
ncbi:MAG: InlB B-repeat-containing protein [Candidatus Natronoplasma sp.]